MWSSKGLVVSFSLSDGYLPEVALYKKNPCVSQYKYQVVFSGFFFLPAQDPHFGTRDLKDMPFATSVKKLSL